MNIFNRYVRVGRKVYALFFRALDLQELEVSKKKACYDRRPVKTFTPFDTRQKTNNRPRTCKPNKNPHNLYFKLLLKIAFPLVQLANYFSKGTPRKSNV